MKGFEDHGRSSRASLQKKGEVYDVLVDRLVNARYSFGERIFVKELVAELGVSRQPIMTALNRLDGDGFVRIVPQVGCQVVSPRPEAIADFFLMFQRMEGLLAELAAERHDEHELEDLRERQQAILSIAGDKEALRRRYAGLNRRFHQVIASMANSPLVSEKQRANFNLSDFFINHAVGFDTFAADAAQEHEEIIEAIAARTPVHARAVAEKHIGSVATAVLAGMNINAKQS